jgi:UDP-N-acetylmuramoyl-tripeptide--D-alanyl-D-alanine ligase
LFVAVRGERVDGNDFAAEAIAGGRSPCSHPAGRVPAIVVGDRRRTRPVGGRRVLARLPRRPCSGDRIERQDQYEGLLAAVLPELGLIAPPGSYNTKIELPLTVLRAGPQTRYLALELGARGTGHIAYLCEIAPPRVGIVLNVGLAHAETFGSREGIAKAKSELVQALPAGGVAVLNADDDRVLACGTGPGPGHHLRHRPVRRGAGRGGRADRLGRARFTLRTPTGSAPVALRLVARTTSAMRSPPRPRPARAGLAADWIAAALSAAEPVSRWR